VWVSLPTHHTKSANRRLSLSSMIITLMMLIVLHTAMPFSSQHSLIDNKCKWPQQIALKYQYGLKTVGKCLPIKCHIVLGSQWKNVSSISGLLFGGWVGSVCGSNGNACFVIWRRRRKTVEGYALRTKWLFQEYLQILSLKEDLYPVLMNALWACGNSGIEHIVWQ